MRLITKISEVQIGPVFERVDVRERPKLKELPMIVGSDPKGGSGSGVVSTFHIKQEKME